MILEGQYSSDNYDLATYQGAARYTLDAFEAACQIAHEHCYEDIFEADAADMIDDFCPDFTLHENGGKLNYEKLVLVVEEEILAMQKRVGKSVMDVVTNNAEHNIRSPNYQVLNTVTTCWKCRRPTNVFGIMLPARHEILEAVGWVGDQGERVYYDIKAVAASVLAELSRISKGRYRMGRYNKSNCDMLINHCEHCDVRQDERTLNRPADSASPDYYAFALITQSAPPAPIHVQTVNKAFAAFGTEWIIYSGCVAEGRITPPAMKRSN